MYFSIFKTSQHIICLTNYYITLDFVYYVTLIWHMCYRYVPKGPGGVSSVLVGGDRLTEGACRNVQWAFADGGSKEDRLEGLTFMFEDWHAIRNLLEVSGKKCLVYIFGTLNTFILIRHFTLHCIF